MVNLCVGIERITKWVRETMPERMNRELEQVNIRENMSFLYKCSTMTDCMSMYTMIIDLYMVWLNVGRFYTIIKHQLAIRS